MCSEINQNNFGTINAKQIIMPMNKTGSFINKNLLIMAELHVQPKKKSSWLPWLIGAILLIALLAFLWRTCNNTTKAVGATDSTSTGGAVATTTPAGTKTPDWNDLDRNAPAANYDEITNKDISVRGNDNYGIYSLGENILFETGKSTILKNSEQNMQQLTASINKRFPGGDLRIYGYTDSVGSSGSNKELAQQRAQSVKTWLATNAGFDSSRISINAIGEEAPVATNATAAGRQQNRRVEIVARKAK